MLNSQSSQEHQRLREHYNREKNWMKWGPYLSERQWGTVREDYSENGDAWNFFPFDHARSRQYRWGEDGIAGICDEFCNLCFGVALWNGNDPFIKERLFGLTGPQGNHGEDVKELYYYLDNTPSHAYMKHLYKYPHAAFPYADLLEQNQRRSKHDPEYELLDTGIFDGNRYFDVFTEYAKADGEDILIKITAYNRSEQEAPLTLLPTLWFRNTWTTGQTAKPGMELNVLHEQYGHTRLTHDKIGDYHFYFDRPTYTLFTENESNTERLFGVPNASPFVKDSINDAVIGGLANVLDDHNFGTKFSPLYQCAIPGGGHVEIRLRLSRQAHEQNPLQASFEQVFADRQAEANDFYASLAPADADPELLSIQRQAFAGMLWTKQFYHIDMPLWLNGDPGLIPPPEARKKGRNYNWPTLNNEDIISMPDKWEYPWYAAWDLAFHCIPFALVDAQFAKNQLLLFLREWYMNPQGQLPAYEWNFSDVNPPVHAWACMEVYRVEKKQTGQGDVRFLKQAFQKLLINFTWWVNRKDSNDNNVFEGGFLGLDNIGVFDRSAGIPGGGYLEQADGTSWMAMYCLNMLDMALEIAQTDDAFEQVATKFFEHFVYIAESLNEYSVNHADSWDEEEGFFYDLLVMPDGARQSIKVRSLVGLTTMFASITLDVERLKNVPEFVGRLQWFRTYQKDSRLFVVVEKYLETENILLSILPRHRLEKILKALLDDQEFLSPVGIRALSKKHETPYEVNINGAHFNIRYEPGESSTDMFGGNSNWRGPIWMPMNYLIIESLKAYYAYYGDEFMIEFPEGSGHMRNLNDIANNISLRLISIFQANESGHRPVNGDDTIYQHDPYFKDLILFYEYFHGDSGRGVGASHQTGWTGLVAELINCASWK
jgi:hypothetical protein